MPNTSSYEERLADVDRILQEVREVLVVAQDAGDLNELAILQMLLQVTKELHGIHHVPQLITKILDSALAFVDGERAFLMLLEAEELRFKMGRDQDGNYLSREDFVVPSSIIEQVLENAQTLLIPDVRADLELSKRDSIQDLALRTIICCPLLIKRNVIGLLYIDSRHTPHISHTSKGYLNFLTSLADQAAVAIRNAQKFETQTE